MNEFGEGAAMELGMVGLGRMGANMARRLTRASVSVAAYNRTFEVAEALQQECGTKACRDPGELVSALDSPRVIWFMLPAGDPTQGALDTLAPLLKTGDIVI